MLLIYQPKGAALEYAPLAMNYYTGCTHRCRYCYVPEMHFPWVNGYFNGPRPKADIIANVIQEAQNMAKKNDTREILLSFVGDPYQHAELELNLTRKVIKVLIENNLHFTILTKGGMRAYKDFSLLRGYPNCSFGTSLVWSCQSDADHWEPEATEIKSRIEAIENAKAFGIKTWISMEPVIDPQQALQVIRDYHHLVDHWKVGKINHRPEIEKRVDWVKFRKDVTALLDSVGADYYIKQSLRSRRYVNRRINRAH